MKTVLKTISVYTFMNVIIAFVYDLLLLIPNAVTDFVSGILSLFVNVFSYVMILLMPIVFIMSVYYLICVIRHTDKTDPFKYMCMNLVNFFGMVYFFVKVYVQISAM